MSDLLLNWLNDDVQLSRRIISFEDDFHNGYLFGELLAKHNQQLNFAQFVDKDDKASRIRNFSLLLDTFTALKIPFDSNVAMRVINRNYGVARKLLYELKTQLEKTCVTAFTKSVKAKPLSPLKKIQVAKDKYDAVTRDHFQKQLNELHPAQKEIVKDRLLKKFGQFHQRSLARTQLLDDKEKQTKMALRDEFIEQRRSNLKKSEEFRKQWDNQNAEKWSKNMLVRNAQLEKDQFFRSKIDQQKNNNKTMTELNARKALEKDIASFELKVLGKKSDDSDDQTPTQPVPLQKTTSKHSTTIRSRDWRAQIRQKSGKQTQQQARHQRQKRRRKTIVQQNKRYQLIQITRRQRYLLATVQQTSKQQKQIQYEIWRAWQHKNIILKGRQLKLDKENEKEETRNINGQFKNVELLKLYREEHQTELAEAMERYKQHRNNSRINQRKVNYSRCLDIVQQLIGITEDIYQLQQQQNTNNVDEQHMQSLLDLFVEGISQHDKPNIGFHELHNYVHGKGQWKIKLQKINEEQSENPWQDNSMPLNAVNNQYLGNALKKIFTCYYDKPLPTIVDKITQRFVVPLMGFEYAGKRSLAKQLQDKYSFHIIDISSLVERRLQQGMMLVEKGLEVGTETQALLNVCYEGKKIPDELILGFVEEEIKVHPMTILLDYPTTYHQAVQLTDRLANVRPHDLMQKTNLQKTIEEFSRLVLPTQSNIVQRTRRPCGVDLALWIDVSIKESLDRVLGRRWLHNGQIVHINSNITNVRQLKTGQKASTMIMRNSFKAKQMPGVRQWFELFGNVLDGKEYNCWQEIDGNKSQEQLKTDILAVFEQAISFRKSLKQWQTQKMNQQQHHAKQKQQAKKKNIQTRAKCVRQSQPKIKQQLQTALNNRQLSPQFLQRASQTWTKLQTSTVAALTRTFHKLHQQQHNMNQYVSRMKKNFIQLLTRQDQKEYLLRRFQIDYNIFCHENGDMVSCDYAKQELHQRVDDLETKLLGIAEEKKDDAITERNSAMASGWLQSQFEVLYQCVYVLLQTELARYVGCQKLLHDYYAKVFMVAQKEQELYNYEITKESYLQLETIKDNGFPRLDKLVSEAVRLFNREEEIIDDKNKKGGKAPVKKQEKKAAKKGGKEEPEKQVEPTKQQLELKKAINTERAIFRYRVQIIKAFARKKLQHVNQVGHKLYTDLQGLISYTYRVQNKSILQLTKQFKQAIQAQQRIQNQLQLRNVQVVQDQTIRNFARQKPLILPAEQQQHPNRFTITNIHYMFKLLNDQSQGGTQITCKRLGVLLNRFNDNQLLRTVLPETWKKLSGQNWQNMLRILDINCKGYVEMRHVRLFVLLTNFILPNQSQLDKYSLELSTYGTEDSVSKEKFVNTAAWFDTPLQHQPSTCVLNIDIRSFDRDKHIKAMLLDTLLETGKDKLSLPILISSLNLSEFDLANHHQATTYYEFIFL